MWATQRLNKAIDRGGYAFSDLDLYGASIDKTKRDA
jgi:hypothetical protein